jgi:hypothetical protein
MVGDVRKMAEILRFSALSALCQKRLRNAEVTGSIPVGSIPFPCGAVADDVHFFCGQHLDSRPGARHSFTLCLEAIQGGARFLGFPVFGGAGGQRFEKCAGGPGACPFQDGQGAEDAKLRTAGALIQLV